MGKKLYIAAAALAFIAACAGAWLLLTLPGGGTASAAASGATVTAYDRTLGDPKAPLTLIEYAAPICPHCAAFAMHDFPVLKANYIDKGKIFYVFRVFPLRPDDGPAEKLARCQPKDKYFAMMDLLFRNQTKWDGAEYPVADDHAGLVQVARIAGMSAAEADKCMADTTMDAAINKVGADAERRYNISGTPTFIVDGTPTAAGLEWPELRTILDAALAKKAR